MREIKKGQENLQKEDYRERALKLYGMICARCGREFNEANRHLLTVHHRDGNHQNNPQDGSNWENLCVYCHDDVHSRSLLGDYLEESSGANEHGLDECSLVYRDEKEGMTSSTLGTVGEKLKKAMEKKKT
ncbi:MAG: YajD family HNH nuclease [Syntrophales bacterium]|nr:YajD family HNH nuclease [Syntrophales bacterium]